MPCLLCLDWLITREGSLGFVHDVRVQDSQLSDHKALFFNFPLRRPGRAQRTVTSRNLKLTNTSEFIADITAVSSALLQHDECHVDLLVELYNTSLKETLDKHAPLTTKRVTSRSLRTLDY